MTDGGGGYTEGFRIDEPSSEELTEVLEAAFDYRGDVTLQLRGGEEVRGYVFNRVADGDQPHVDLFPDGSDDSRRVLYSDIRAIHFSGRDTASGKSWETWVKHYREKQAARERGEDVGEIGLTPEPLS